MNAVNSTLENLLSLISWYQDSDLAGLWQVQDVGLIFLSAMASSIASGGLKKHDSPEDIMGTTLLTLTISTFLVGLLIIIVGEHC